MQIKRRLRSLLQRLPDRYQHAVRAVRYCQQQQRGHFISEEPEFGYLPKMLGPGDWALDIGANVGHYARRLATIVGPTGRVIAVEPVPPTFALLAANVSDLGNVTCINAAASSHTGVVSMTVPTDRYGLENQYRAQVGTGPLQVLTLSLDSLNLTSTVKLIKIDVEGHELACLRGMESLIARDHPDLIVEGGSQVADLLVGFGYSSHRLKGSPNTVFSCRAIWDTWAL